MVLPPIVRQFMWYTFLVLFHLVRVETSYLRKKLEPRATIPVKENMGGSTVNTQLTQFFAQLLGLVEPWYISRIEQQELEVHIHVDFTRGAKFPFKKPFSRFMTPISASGGT